MFIPRLLSSATILALTITTTVIGGPVLLGTLFLLSLLGLYELFRSIQMERSELGLVGYLAVAAHYFALYWGKGEFQTPVLVMAFTIIMTLYVFCYPKYDSKQVTMAFFGIFYVAVLLSYLYRNRSLEGGAYMVWLVYIGAWGSDTCAYVVGRMLGKHRLPSPLSPKKTVEGCLGGVVGAALIGALFATVFQEKITLFPHPQWTFALFAAMAAVLSQIGDLAASAIKRNHGIKDYGNVIPGHGGILDRFDSVLLVAPMVYYLIRTLI